MKNKKQYRQGDLLVERVPSKKVSGKDASENGRLILAHGEATGHAHEVISDSATLIRKEDEKAVGDLLLSVRSDAEIVHQEHAPISLMRGSYRITRQMEYSPKAPQRVAD
jgi:hypothetical protein